MLFVQGRHVLFVFIIFFSGMVSVFAQTDDNPCTGPAKIVNWTDRGGNIDSPCILPVGTAFLEGGYQYFQLVPSGQAQTLPQGEFRIGLPKDFELGLFSPNYTNVFHTNFEGYGPFAFDIKRRLGYSESWIFSAEAMFILPGGSATFGTEGFEGTFSGVFTYSINDKWSVTGMMQVGSFTDPTLFGGGRFTSLTPDIVLTYAPIEKINIFGELYSFSPTGPGEGSALLMDYGVIYMLTPKFAIDLGYYRQLGNNPALFSNSYAGGITVMLG